MKPRIWKRDDRWYCAGAGKFACGYGFTPLDAYLSWVAVISFTRKMPDAPKLS